MHCSLGSFSFKSILWPSVTFGGPMISTLSPTLITSIIWYMLIHTVYNRYRFLYYSFDLPSSLQDLKGTLQFSSFLHMQLTFNAPCVGWNHRSGVSAGWIDFWKSRLWFLPLLGRLGESDAGIPPRGRKLPGAGACPPMGRRISLLKRKSSAAEIGAGGFWGFKDPSVIRWKKQRRQGKKKKKRRYVQNISELLLPKTRAQCGDQSAEQRFDAADP